MAVYRRSNLGRAAVLLVLGVCAASAPLLACSCASGAPLCSAYWKTPSLFLGHVVRIEHVARQFLVHFDVLQTYRGTAEGEIVVSTADQGPACGYAFQAGHDYLVEGHAAATGELSTSHCSRTHEVPDRSADPDIQWMESLPKAPPGAAIFGRLQKLQPNHDGGYDVAGIANIPVILKGPQSKTVLSDMDGKFRADRLVAGNYTVSAQAPPGYQPFPSSTVTIMERGCAEVAWSTRVDGHIRGHAYFSDGSPAAGVFLVAKNAFSSPNQPWTTQPSYATSNAEGGFDFAPLSPGSYVFAVNMDFSAQDGKPYYRRAFFPGTVQRAEAAVLTLGSGETIDDLRFVLPPDLPPPSIPVDVTVLGFHGEPQARAEVRAYDDIWESSVTPVAATADEHGKTTVVLRPGAHYDIEAYVTLSNGTQACAEPSAMDAGEKPKPVVLVLQHPFGNCLQYRKH